MVDDEGHINWTTSLASPVPPTSLGRKYVVDYDITPTGHLISGTGAYRGQAVGFSPMPGRLTPDSVTTHILLWLPGSGPVPR